MGGSALWDFGDFGETIVKSQEELLRDEYPDLKEKWYLLQDCKKRFEGWERRLSHFTWFERCFKTRSYIFAWRMIEQRKRKMKEANTAYYMLKKLLEDH